MAKKSRDDMNDRMCIVTRQSGSIDDLIRFVEGPDGSVVPDLKRKLPGRGCWVLAQGSTVQTAIDKKLFARALKSGVKAAPDLVAQIDQLLVADLAQMMHLARKAGQFVSGAMKVDNAVRSGEALAVFHAQNAAADGIRKVDQARKAFHLAMETEEAIPSFQPLEPAEMDKLLGENAFMHAATLAGQAGEGVVKRAKILERYRNSGAGMEKGNMALEKQ